MEEVIVCTHSGIFYLTSLSKNFMCMCMRALAYSMIQSLSHLKIDNFLRSLIELYVCVCVCVGAHVSKFYLFYLVIRLNQ